MNSCNVRFCNKNNDISKINNNYSSCICNKCINTCNNYSFNQYDNKIKYTLNPQAIYEKQSKDFSNSNNLFNSNDPRLNKFGFITHNLNLDSVPQTSYDMTSNVNTDNTLNNYGKNYKNYSDINAGNIVYYINNEKTPNYLPKLHKHSKDIKNIYIDPMGGISLQNCNKLKPFSCEKRDKNCLSYIQDTNNHRLELLHNISKSMAINHSRN